MHNTRDNDDNKCRLSTGRGDIDGGGYAWFMARKDMIKIFLLAVQGGIIGSYQRDITLR